MKIALAQLNYHIGNFDSNVLKIKQCLDEQKEQGVDLVVFSELSVCGYPPRDFLSFKSFVDRCESAVKEIALSCIGIAAVVGAPALNSSSKGKKLYNSAYFLKDGKVFQQVNKTLLPTYDIFDEYRYFEPNSEFKIVEYKGEKIAITICEDIWNVDEDGIYKLNPVEELMIYKPDFIINIAASPFALNHQAERLRIIRANAVKYQLPVYYVNHIGAQTELIFDGGSMAMDKSGELKGMLSSFKEDLQVFQTQNGSDRINYQNPDKYDEIENALILGIDNYFKKLNFKKAIIGLSGGIDSALTLVLAVRALGNENVLAVLMPSDFSSTHSISDSIELCNNLGCNYEEVPISAAYDNYISMLEPYFKGLKFDVTEENIQARIRATILMAFSNKFGNILLNTSNKSELAVGYGTLYGDMCGGLSVLGDLYKTEVYELSKWINSKTEVIPSHIIQKPASAELRPDQKDSDSLPDYEVLDKLLRCYIEGSMAPEEIVNKGFKPDLVAKILKMVNTTEYKRFQAPPVLRVSSKAFGMGRRMPIVGKYLS